MRADLKPSTWLGVYVSTAAKNVSFETNAKIDMVEAHKALADKLREHSRLSTDELAALKSLPCQERDLAVNEDLVRQGDAPNVSALVLRGFVARYHLLRDGRRQFLSFHMKGDLPDAQALFLDHMDHAVCALEPSAVALLPHRDLFRIFESYPKIAFAIWRETLIDAAIFREAITNNSARAPSARLAHIFSELFFRAHASNLTEGGRIELPVSLPQLAEALGMGLATVNRALATLRASNAVDFRSGVLTVHDWARLQKLGHFDSAYLHLRKGKMPRT